MVRKILNIKWSNSAEEELSLPSTDESLSEQFCGFNNLTNGIHKLKLISLNCCSLRSQSKRNHLAALLSDYDADIVLGCESHIDHSILSSEILPVTYKIIHKDRCLGGGVFIGYKDHLNVCEESSLILDAEMVWI